MTTSAAYNQKPDFNSLTARWTKHPSLQFDTVSLAGRLYASADNSLHPHGRAEQRKVYCSILRESKAGDNLQEFANQLALNNNKMPHPLAINPDSTPTNEEWLQIEANMVKSSINHHLRAQPSLSLGLAIECVNQIAENSLTVPSQSVATGKQHDNEAHSSTPLPAKVLEEALVSSSAACLIWMIIFKAGFVLADPIVPDPPIGAYAVSVLLAMLLALVQYNYMLKCVQGTTHKAAILPAISPTWAEVLAMQKPADCLLVAQLYSLLCDTANKDISLAGLNTTQACKLAFSAKDDQNSVLALLVDPAAKTTTRVPVPTVFNAN